MTPPEESAPTPETLLAAASLESGTTPYAQQTRVGHHVVPSDESAARGGGDTGPSPTGLLLAALASCTSITLRMYADRKGWDVGRVYVDVRFVRVGATDRIDRTIRFGSTLTPEQFARLGVIADKTPVTKMVMTGVPIVTRVDQGGSLGRRGGQEE
jgi:putative redox protein